MAAPLFYNQADQNIYSQGYSFIPQEKFRGGAFNFPTSATTTETATAPVAAPIGVARDPAAAPVAAAAVVAGAGARR